MSRLHMLIDMCKGFICHIQWLIGWRILLVSIVCSGNVYSEENRRAFQNTYLVQVEITGSVPFVPESESWYARAYRDEQLVLLEGVIREVYNGPNNLVGQSVSLASPRIMPLPHGDLMHSYTFDGVSVKGKEPVGALAIVPFVPAEDYRTNPAGYEAWPNNEFPYRSVFSISHPASREIVWDRQIGVVNHDPHLYESTLKWAESVGKYNTISKDNDRIEMLRLKIMSENSLLSVSAVHILFKEHNDSATTIAKKLVRDEKTPVISKIALDHELTLALGSTWREGGQDILNRKFGAYLDRGDDQKNIEYIMFRNKMLRDGHWDARARQDIEDEYVWGVKKLPVFSGYLVEGVIDEVIRGRRNILTGEISSAANVYDVIVKVVRVYVGPEQLEGVTFSARGEKRISLDGRDVALRPVGGVGLGRAEEEGLAKGEHGLWHLVTATGGHQDAFLGSSLMSARGYGGYIHYDDSNRANSWKVWAQVLSDILRSDSTPAIENMMKLLSHDVPEVSVWSCHAIARLMGKNGIDVLFESAQRSSGARQAWILIGIDDAFSRILKSWHSSRERMKVYDMLILTNIDNSDDLPP